MRNRKYKKYLKIGLMGVTTGNENLGCVALTYSLILILEKIRSKNGMEFHYYIFEPKSVEEKIQLLCQKCHVDRERISVCPMSNPGVIHKGFTVVNLHKTLMMMDCVIDITGGDSFSDIYGQKRFDYYTRLKRFVQVLRIPLILAPQTYGPFNCDRNFDKAADVINKCVLVISRDQLSKKYLEKACSKSISVTTDVAVVLPYHTIIQNECDKKHIGINISGLLYNGGTEKSFDNDLVKKQYTLYINQLVEKMSQSGKYKIHLISHVKNDYEAAKMVAEQYPACILVDTFSDPIAAKDYISGMDVFIGSRMHATIASFTSGVATIPVAYSRKFEGFFGNLDYNYCISLENQGYEDSVKITFDLVDREEELCSQIAESMLLAEKLILKTENQFERVLQRLYNK